MYRKLTKSDKWQIVLIIAYTIFVLLFIGSARADTKIHVFNLDKYKIIYNPLYDIALNDIFVEMQGSTKTIIWSEKPVWEMTIPLCYPLPVSAKNTIKSKQSKYLKPFSKDWLADRTLKYGTLISYCTAQSLTGISEGYKFNGNSGYLMNEGNYHAYQTVMRVSWIGAGFITQGIIRSPHRTWIGKIKRIIGSACIARNAFEWSYKWQRYNNPFDTQLEHNRNAVVYFGIRNGGVVDLYFSTGKVTTPLTDIAFLILGLWLWE